jgi:hypothetical protein
MSVALEELRSRFPTLVAEPQPRNNPGFDILLAESGNTRSRRGEHFYIEVKGTTRRVPVFFATEGELQFSRRNANRFRLVVVYKIQLAPPSYEVYWHEGAIEDGTDFRISPVQWACEVVLFPALFRDALLTLARDARGRRSHARPWVDWGEKGERARDGGLKREVVVRSEECSPDGEVVASEQKVQLVEVGDEDRDEGIVGRRSLPVKDAIQLAEVGVVGEQRLLGGNERGVEDGERCELGRSPQLRRGGDRRGAHVTSVRAAATWSAVTVLDLATAAAMRP